MQVCFSYIWHFCQHYHLWTYRIPYPLLRCSTTLLLIKEFTSQRSVAMDSCSWDSLVFPCSSTFWSNCFDRTVEWPLVDTVITPARQQYLAGLGQDSPKHCICSKSASTTYGTISFIARIHRSRDQGMETRMVLLNVTPNDPPSNKMCASCPHILMLCWPSRLSSRRGNASTRRHNSNIPSNWKLILPEPQSKKRVMVMAGVIDPDYHVEIGLLFQQLR